MTRRTNRTDWVAAVNACAVVLALLGTSVAAFGLRMTWSLLWDDRKGQP